jgi:Phospholipase A2-like domain
MGCSIERMVRNVGGGLINTLINKIPIELHLPGYRYCGPGTKLRKRLARGDPGINLLDEACKEHDILYSKHRDTYNRNIADKILAEKAWLRVKSADATLGERANALLVTSAMKAKVKLGAGVKKSKKINNHKNPKETNHTFRTAVLNARKSMKLNKPENVSSFVKIALNAAKNVIKRKKTVKTPRIIPIPKTGGILPFLVPLFAGLSAAGALSGGAAGIVKAINEASDARKQLLESKRHNQTMESIALGHGLYLQPYKNGLGLYIDSDLKN